jgi:hypothetical protein
MGKEVQAIVIGAGSTGRVAIKAMVEQGVKIVGAVGHVHNIGRDVGELSGIGPVGVTLQKDVASVLDSCSGADIAVVAVTQNEMEELRDLFISIIERGINIVTVCGQPYFPWAYNAEIADEIDRVAVEHNVTVLGTGIEDPFWHNLPLVLASAVTNIREIHGMNTALLEMQGPASISLCHAGKSIDEFKDAFRGQDPEPTAFLPTLKCIAKDLGLTITKRHFSIEPLIAEEDISFPEYDVFVPKGKLSGMVERLSFDTEEGIVLSGDFRAKVSEPGDTGASIWKIDADPEIVNITENIAGEYTTGMAMVSRIPDVINAEPGFKTVADMPRGKYHVRPLGDYAL